MIIIITNKGYLKYSGVTGESTAEIDEKKIEKDARWDGLHAVITNNKNCNIEIYKSYRRLWIIEESFRINKSNLKMRPIYHFTHNRIQAHILLCYMVFTLIRHTQFRISCASYSMSTNRIIDAIKNIQASILLDTTTDKKYKILSSLSLDAKLIYKTFKIDTKMSVTSL